MQGKTAAQLTNNAHIRSVLGLATPIRARERPQLAPAEEAALAAVSPEELLAQQLPEPSGLHPAPDPLHRGPKLTKEVQDEVPPLPLASHPLVSISNNRFF